MHYDPAERTRNEYLGNLLRNNEAHIEEKMKGPILRGSYTKSTRNIKAKKKSELMKSLSRYPIVPRANRYVAVCIMRQPYPREQFTSRVHRILYAPGPANVGCLSAHNTVPIMSECQVFDDG